jgi:hypothetical protein
MHTAQTDSLKAMIADAQTRPLAEGLVPAVRRGGLREAVEALRRDVINNVAWTLRDGFEGVLARIPSSAWSDPHGQPGWTCIKHNDRREVWRIRLGSDVHFLKCYTRSGLGNRIKTWIRGSAARAEWESGLYAQRAGIPAARPIAFTDRLRFGGRTCSVLISRAIERSRSLDDSWSEVTRKATPRDRRDVAGRLAEVLADTIARAHQAGFEHLDMHAANILVRQTGGLPHGPAGFEAAFVDLHSARLGSPVNAAAVVRNLAQLNQWFARHSTLGERLRFLRAYLRRRNEYEHAYEHGRPLDLTFEQLVATLRRRALRHAARLWAQRDRRAMRNGRYFARLRLRGGWRGHVMLRCKRPTPGSAASQLRLRREWWSERLADPQRWLREGESSAYKYSHSGLVTRVSLQTPDGPLEAIVKRPRPRNLWRRLRHLLPPSRSLRAWRLGNALLNRDLPTARPLAVLERRAGPFVTDSLLITEVVDHALDLEAHLRREHADRSPRAWRRHKRRLINLLARQTRLLEERGFSHRDYKAQNLLIALRPQLRLVWIDLDGIRHERRTPSVNRRLRALSRLHVSLLDVPGLTRTDRVRFLKSYLARFGSDPRAWRRAWPVLDGMVRDKLASLHARREWKLQHYGRV